MLLRPCQVQLSGSLSSAVVGACSTATGIIMLRACRRSRRMVYSPGTPPASFNSPGLSACPNRCYRCIRDFFFFRRFSLFSQSQRGQALLTLLAPYQVPGARYVYYKTNPALGAQQILRTFRAPNMSSISSLSPETSLRRHSFAQHGQRFFALVLKHIYI